jgi:hypothetical protein
VLAVPQPPIADAVADAAGAINQIVDDRIEIVRLEARHDVRRILWAVALGFSGLIVMTVGVVAGVAAIVWSLSVWVPVGASLGVIAVGSALAGARLTRVARARMPRPGIDDAIAARGGPLRELPRLSGHVTAQEQRSVEARRAELAQSEFRLRRAIERFERQARFEVSVRRRIVENLGPALVTAFVGGLLLGVVPRPRW